MEQRIKKAAQLCTFLSDYQRVWQIDQVKDAYLELREFFRLFDPRHSREFQVFNNLGYIDIQHLASRVKADVLWGIGLMDTICPPSSQFAAYNKIPSNKQMLIYPDYEHEDIPGFNDLVFQFMKTL